MQADSRFHALLLITCEDGLVQSIPESVGTGQISVTAKNKRRFLSLTNLFELNAVGVDSLELLLRLKLPRGLRPF